MTNKPGAVTQHPLYGCTSCYEEHTWPAGDLRVYDNECWCDECWDERRWDFPGQPCWNELEPYTSALQAECQGLQADYERLQAEHSDDTYRLDRYRGESAPKTIRGLLAERDALQVECEELRAFKAEVESQKPDCWRITHRSFCGIVTDKKEIAEDPFYSGCVFPLYAKPVPADKPAVAVPDEWRRIVERAANIIRMSGVVSHKLNLLNSWLHDAESLLDAPSHSQQSAEVWQPIETAPKDGTHILLANKSGVSEGGLLTDIDHGAEWEGQIGMAGWWRADGTDWPPTHWMPLPKPPSA